MPQERPSLGEILAALEDQGLALVLLLLAVPAVVPTPGVPAGMIFGTALAIIAVQMAAGARRFRLPAPIARLRIHRNRLENIVHRVGPRLARVERRLAPRWPGLTQPGPARQLLGLVVCFMAVLVALPIPFGNTLPGLSVLAVALGLARCDGMAIAVGLALAVLACLASLVLVVSGWTLIEALFSGLALENHGSPR